MEGATPAFSGDDVTTGNTNITISGNTGVTTSGESPWQYKETPTSIKIEPNYYTLIFIMKL
jgi:hypothetical protein